MDRYHGKGCHRCKTARVEHYSQNEMMATPCQLFWCRKVMVPHGEAGAQAEVTVTDQGIEGGGLWQPQLPHRRGVHRATPEACRQI
jgi:hypothetical protein